MQKKLLQGIAIGLLISTSLFAYQYYFTNEFKADEDLGEQANQFEHLLEDYLTTNNLVIVDQKSYEQFLMEQTVAMEVANTNELKEITVVIELGMSSWHVALLLEQLNLVEDAQLFEDYVQERNIATKIRAGKYEFTTSMTLAEIVEALT